MQHRDEPVGDVRPAPATPVALGVGGRFIVGDGWERDRAEELPRIEQGPLDQAPPNVAGSGIPAHSGQNKTYLEDEWKTSGQDNVKGGLWGYPEFTAQIWNGATGAFGLNATYSGYISNAHLTWSPSNSWGRSDDIYAMCAVAGTRLWGAPGYFTFTSIPTPDRTYMFGEGACNLLNRYIDPAVAGSFSDQREVYFQGQSRYIDQQRHRGRSNVLFGDLLTATVSPIDYRRSLAAPDQVP